MVETRKTQIDCECRCCKLEFTVDEYEWGDNSFLSDYTFSFNSNYLGKQNSRWRAAWNALTGKETIYSELCTTKAQARKFLEECLKLVEESK